MDELKAILSEIDLQSILEQIIAVLQSLFEKFLSSSDDTSSDAA